MPPGRRRRLTEVKRAVGCPAYAGGMQHLWLAAALAAIAPAALAADEIPLGAEQLKALGIETAEISTLAGGELQGIPAQVVVPAAQQRVVSVPLPALVETVLVATQQAVRKGQTVARLQSPGLADLQHTYLQAVTQASLAQANLERDEELYGEGVIARSRLLATRAHHAEVSADLAERTQALRLAGMSEAALARLRAGRAIGTAIELYAPIDGVVLEQAASPGQRLDAMAPVMRIARLDPLWLELQLPAAQLAEVAPGAAVAVPAADAAARVIAVGRSTNAANQTVLVRAVTTRGAERLRPGQFVEASIAGRAGDGRWSVPNTALVRHQRRVLVFVRTPAGFRAQEVKLVAEGAERSVVTGGFRGGERVAVKGAAMLKARLAGIGG